MVYRAAMASIAQYFNGSWRTYNAPSISNRTLKVMERAGQIERRYSNAALRRTTLLQIKDALGAGLSFTGSAIGGNIKLLAVAVVREE